MENALKKLAKVNDQGPRKASLSTYLIKVSNENTE